MNKRYPHPPTYQHLRALLKLTENAIGRKDLDDLAHLYEINYAIDSDWSDNMRIYIVGSIESIQGEDYSMYTTEEIGEVKESLTRLAYGNFDEAMATLYNDLSNCGYTDSKGSDIFQNKYFSKAEGKIWRELRRVLNDCRENTLPHTKKFDNTIDQAIDKLRHYQQKSYGGLIPTIIGTYRSIAPNQTGVSFRLLWRNDCLEIDTPTELHKKFQKLVLKQNKITSKDSFKIDNLPKVIEGRELESADTSELFLYEI